MKKFKKDFIYLSILFLSFLAFVFFYTQKGAFLYASTTDFESQHYLLPEYFRTLFYETKQLIPSFAPHIGAGQNIFYFAYYGFLSPLFLPSYFLPFVPMVVYVIFVDILVVLFSIFLFYKWMRHHFDEKISFFTSFLFLLSGPLVFHSHRHIMFINYMPFLLLGLIGIDRYFEKEKDGLFIISIFLLIMTSYFYSVGGILCLLFYGIFVYLKRTEKNTWNHFWKEWFRFLLRIFTGILLSSFFLLPILFTILQGRNNMGGGVSFFSLLIPKVNFSSLFYRSYSIGLTSISLWGLSYSLFSKKKEFIFLGISLLSLLIFPIFVYLLNGTLYQDSKALIPILPLFLFLIAFFLSHILKKEIPFFFKISLFTGFLLVLSFKHFSNFYKILVISDFFLLFVSLLFAFKCKKDWLFYGITLFTAGISFWSIQQTDRLISKEKWIKDFSSNIDSSIQKLYETDKTYFRINNTFSPLSTINKVYNGSYFQTSLYSSMYNRLYNTFYYQIFENETSYRNAVITPTSKNILFDTYMGIKYKIAEAPFYGYQKTDIPLIQKNNFALPIGYGRGELMSLREFESLKYPYTLDALLRYEIVDLDMENVYESKINSTDLSSKASLPFPYQKTDSGYEFTLQEEKSFSLPLEKQENQILFILFDMLYSESCSKGDTEITINGVKNKLTCSSWKYHNQNYTFYYVLSSREPIKELSIKIGKGTYKIANIASYVLDKSVLENLVKTVDPFEIDPKKTRGNTIFGQIDVKEDGYFHLSIPYDSGFKIFVDGNQVSYEKVDKTFLGFPIAKGHHEIQIFFEAPFLKVGKILSTFGFVFFLFLIFGKRHRQKVKDTV